MEVDVSSRTAPLNEKTTVDLTNDHLLTKTKQKPYICTRLFVGKKLSLRTFVKVAATVLILVAVSIAYAPWFKTSELVHFIGIRMSEQEGIPVVLAWTAFFSADLANRLNMELGDCPFRCNFTKDRRLLQSADAVIFHIRNSFSKDLPKFRDPRQYFIFFLMEAPPHTGKEIYSISKDYFNLTMTFRRDSDIYRPYGSLVRIQDVVTAKKISSYETVMNRLKKKNKPVLQFVSNCATHSKRENYVRELKKYINVTQIGRCSKTCSDECEKKAIDEHLFYLAFENSVCKDYITEKLFSYLGDFLPIVLKRSIIDNILPSNAFLAADDFNSPKELANHLKYLQQNRTELIKHFDWIESYGWGPSPSCKLCAFLHEKPRRQKIIPDIRRWWFDLTPCHHSFASTILSGKLSNSSSKSPYLTKLQTPTTQGRHSEAMQL